MSTDMHPQQRDPWAAPGSPGWVGPGSTPPTSSSGPVHERVPRDRGPGWTGTVTAAVLAALLAAGGTAAAFTALDEDAAAPSASSSESSSSEPGSAQPAPPAATADGVDWGTVADAVAPSVVSIQVRGQAGSGEGSGVVIDADGHVLTNDHVISAGGPAQIRVVLSDGTVLAADVVGTDPGTDLAVLRLQDPPADLPPLEFGDSSGVGVGQPVMAVGNPLGLSHTVTTGIVSAVDRPVTTQASGSARNEQGSPVVTNAIQTDAAVNPGNSGGALVDASGRLIGINSSIASLGATAGAQAGSIGLGFAIPANQAQWVAQELIANGSVQHAYLGVSLQDTVVQADGADREAAGIAEVVPGTPAADVGLRAGEAVVAVDGEPVNGAESLVAQVRERQPGTDVQLTIAGTDGQTREVTVQFGVRPAG